jgi:hypothetical protein
MGAILTSLFASIGKAVLSIIGFTAAGPAAGTMASNMMSAAAIANGGGIASGSTVSVLQGAAMGGSPAVAAGIGTATVAAGVSIGARLAKLFGMLFSMMS